MSRGLIHVEIKGKKYIVPFSMGTLEHLEQITGEDPYKFTIPLDSVKGFLDGVSTVVYAALLSNSAVKEEQPEYTREDVARYIKSLTYAEVSELLKVYQSAYGTASQEGSGDTQGAASNVE